MINPDITNAYIERHIRQYQAELRSKTVFGRAGRAVIRTQGERIVLGPNGERIRVVQLPAGDGPGHTQVEHGDHVHANIRPNPLTLTLKVQ